MNGHRISDPSARSKRAKPQSQNIPCQLDGPKPSITIKGYAVVSGMFEHPIATTMPASVRKTRTIPYSHSSRPIIEMLTGIRDLKATFDTIKAEYTSPVSGAQATETLGLIVVDANDPSDAFTVPLPLDGGVTAAVRIRCAGKAFDAEPCALFGDGLQQAVVMHFQSAAVSALVKMTRESFSKVLENSALATGCLHALRANCPVYSPKTPGKRDWMTASIWPDWQARRLGFDARAIELAPHVGENLPDGDAVSAASARLRQCCSRRLGLAISDRSDV